MRLYTFHSAPEPAPRPAPPGTTLIAVGDVHGHVAHFDTLLDLLQPAIEGARTQARDCQLVLIGDYVDRGPDNLGVLRRLLTLEARLGIPVRALRGNHDQHLIDFILAEKPAAEAVEAWCHSGGDGVLAELGITREALQGRPLGELAALARRRAGADVLDLLRRLTLRWRCGAYVFVHAGIHPRRPLEAQGPREFLWLREPFLSGGDWRPPFAVVHGHTIRGPEVHPHRIAIDSGCYCTGVLTALILADDRARFICVSDREDLSAFQQLEGQGQERRFTRPAPVQPRSK